MRHNLIVCLVGLSLLLFGCVRMPGLGNNDVEILATGVGGEESEKEAGDVGAANPCNENAGKLLFAADSSTDPQGDTNFDIYVANADGSGASRVGDNPIWDGYPVWSPDQCRIAYAASISGESQTEIFIMDANGQGATRLTTDPAQDREPSWSPDGTQIVFTRDDGDNRDLFIMNVDGSDLRQLTDSPDEDEKPEWSPDSDLIVFQSRRDGNWEIYLIQSDGNGLTRLTSDKMQDTHPTWSPDGERIAFLSNRSAYNEIYIINTDGSNLRQVTSQGGGALGIAIELNWARSGDRLAFECTGLSASGGGAEDLCIANVESGAVETLVHMEGQPAREPDW